MKKRISFICFGIALIVVFLPQVLLFAQEFSADLINTTQLGSSQGKIFVRQGKVRLEFPETITVTRMDKKVVWVLIPAQKIYMEQPFDPSNLIVTTKKMDNEVSREVVGVEVIDGKMATKYKVVYKDALGKDEVILIWVAEGLDIPLKTAAEDSSWVMEYRNIKTTSPDDSLFEIPADYQKISMQLPPMGDIHNNIDPPMNVLTDGLN
jgi:hypothetical protein